MAEPSREVFWLIVYPSVSDWPRWSRRAFLATLPVSGPLFFAWWAVALIGSAVVMLIVAFLIVPFLWLVDRVLDCRNFFQREWNRP